MNKLLTILLMVFAIVSHVVASPEYNVMDFGAKGNGKALDSDAINAAIEAASSKGGGTVYLPSGTYLSFSIRLKSNIRLYLESGCTIVAASPADFEGKGYDSIMFNIWGDSLKYQDFGHSHWRNSLIWGIGLENVIIDGYGIIDGKGLERFRNRPGTGNKAIALRECKKVTIKNITIFRGGHFGILPTGVDNLTIDNVKIDTNRDGINLDCCSNVRISNCDINAPNDDAIVLKSSYALGRSKPTENIVITNCHVSGYDMGSMLSGTYQTTQLSAPDKGGVTGRIKFGTESNGGFRNITISNITFSHCRGLALESVDGANIENVTITNISMRDIVDSGIFVRIGSRLRSPAGTKVGETDRIIISNVNICGVPPRYAVMIMGIPGHPVNGVTLNDINILVEGGAPVSQAENVVPEKETGYPDPMYYGDIPAYGFFVRHASNIKMNNIDVQCKKADGRPAFVLDDVKNININNVLIDKHEGVAKNIVSKGVSNLITTGITER